MCKSGRVRIPTDPILLRAGALLDSAVRRRQRRRQSVEAELGI